jgi:hypothetical protein
VEEDPERGILRFDAIPAGTAQDIKIKLNAEGNLSATTSFPRAGSGPVCLGLDLVPAGKLEVQFVAPEVRFSRLHAERWHPETQRWLLGSGDDLLLGVFEAGQEALRTTDGLQPGWHRLVYREGWEGDAQRWVTLPFYVPAGGAVVRRRLDLRGLHLIEGRIEAAGAEEPGKAIVVPLGDDQLVPLTLERARRHGFPVRPGGSFTLRCAGDPPAAIAVRHPALRAVPEVLPLEGTGPHHALSFRLEAGTIATFRPLLDLPPEFAEHGRLRVLVFDGDPAGVPVSEHEATCKDGVAWFGGFKPGTWTVVVDPPSLLEYERPHGDLWEEKFVRRLPSRVPSVLSGVVLGESATDLGEVRFEPGLELRVRISSESEGPVGPFRVVADVLDPPAYQRATTTRGLREVALGGLRPGRVRVRVNWLRAFMTDPLLEEALTLDGGPPPVLEVKLP